MAIIPLLRVGKGMKQRLQQIAPMVVVIAMSVRVVLVKGGQQSKEHTRRHQASYILSNSNSTTHRPMLTSSSRACIAQHYSASVSVRSGFSFTSSSSTHIAGATCVDNKMTRSCTLHFCMITTKIPGRMHRTGAMETTTVYFKQRVGKKDAQSMMYTLRYCWFEFLTRKEIELFPRLN
jgi:hypothetical protein